VGGRKGIIVAALICASVLTAAARPTTAAAPNPLTQVNDLGHGRIAVHFRLPSTDMAYAVQFITDGGALKNTVSLNPWSTQPASLYATTRTPSTWIVDGKGLVLLGKQDYSVHLIYARKSDCKAATAVQYGIKSTGTTCVHTHQSPAIDFHLGVVGSSGPGSLVGRSSGSGIAGSASVSGAIPAGYQTVDVRVTATPSQDVHVEWISTCTRGNAVKTLSGNWEDTTPVDESFRVRLGYVGTGASCRVTIGATLMGDGGSVTLSVYASR
jgi:hypothetical protein